MTFSIMTLSTIGLFATLQNSNVCRYADCRVFYCNAEYRSATLQLIKIVVQYTMISMFSLDRSAYSGYSLCFVHI